MSHDAPRADAPRRDRKMPRGQVLVIFAFLLTILIGMAAFVVDIAWIWSHQLQVQRAADAGALAGVVHLPQQPNAARTAAQAESRKNGYANGTDGVVVVANQDPSFGRRMVVTVSAPVDTFFMRVFGFDEVTVSRTARAEYILPVPMGSPQNYYGVGRFRDAVTTTTTTTATVDDNTGFNFTSRQLSSGGQWSTADRAYSNNDEYTTEDTTGHAHQWDTFNLQNEISAATGTDVGSVVIRQLEVRFQDVRLTGSGNSSSCRIRTELSWNGGTSWSTALNQAVTSTSDSDPVLGAISPLSTSPWGGHTWTLNELSDANFRVRLTWQEPNSNCGSTRAVRLDGLEVRASYRFTQTTVTTNTSIQTVPVRDPYDTVDLVPQRFWGAMQSQGAPSIQGDAFMTKFTTRTSSFNPTYCPTLGYCANDPDGYYNYAIEIPGGGGEVWIFDPGFCDVGTTEGTGENWTVGGANGSSTPEPVSAFYKLYNTNNTAWDFGDDTRVDTKPDNAYRRGAGSNGARYYDSDLTTENEIDNSSPPAFTECNAQTWHNEWWQIASGLPAGTYRLHTTSHDLGSPSDQDNTTALNAFAIWARAAGGINGVKVYGLGAMEAYFPLPGNQVSTFYLAQIEAIHAGKWVDISLWDPGDTGSLTADLSIMIPTAGGYTPATFYSNSISGTLLPESFTCGPETSSGQTSIRTSAGTGGIYNGDWVRLCVQIPDNYTAPTPPGETQSGWWKISYNMTGSGNSTDLTTWKVDIRGNPVHLIIPEDDTPTP